MLRGNGRSALAKENAVSCCRAPLFIYYHATFFVLPFLRSKSNLIDFDRNNTRNPVDEEIIIRAALDYPSQRYTVVLVRLPALSPVCSPP